MLDPSSRAFLRAGRLRLKAANALMAPIFQGVYGADAMYLAGYAVECVLKAVLIERTATGHRNAMMASFENEGGWHDLERIKERLRRYGVNLPPQLRSDLSRVSGGRVKSL